MASREQRATQRLGRRIATMFDNLAAHAGEAAAEGGIRISLPITQSDIADLFDVTRQSVHREVSHLKQLKLVEKQQGEWIVLDPLRLRRMCTY
jgi:CRP-like cAMP-binding protein